MISAIIWDYDGTIADSLNKNYSVTLDMLEIIFPKIKNNLPEVLESPQAFFEATKKYEDWRELYKKCYNMNDDEVKRAGSLWSYCQLNNHTKTELFTGISEIFSEFSFCKHAIVSQNCSKNIKAVLEEYNLSNSIDYICGYEDVPLNKPKPNYETFLQCIRKLDLNIATDLIIYIGDHEEDVMFVKNTQRYFVLNNINSKLVSIAVDYSGSSPNTWKNKADYVAHSPIMLKDILFSINRGDCNE